MQILSYKETLFRNAYKLKGGKSTIFYRIAVEAKEIIVVLLIANSGSILFTISRFVSNEALMSILVASN